MVKEGIKVAVATTEQGCDGILEKIATLELKTWMDEQRLETIPCRSRMAEWSIAVKRVLLHVKAAVMVEAAEGLSDLVDSVTSHTPK